MPGQKEGVKLIGRALGKTTFKGVGKTALGIVVIPPAAVAGFRGAVSVSRGEGLLKPALDIAIGEETVEEIKEEGLLEMGGDIVLGEGGTDKVVEKLDAAAEKAKDVATDVKNTAKEAYDNTRQAIAEMQERRQQQMMSDYQQMMPMQQYGGSSLLSPFSSITNLISSITGGQATGSNLLTLMASAFLLFGKFGWLGKLIGLPLATLGMKSMFQQNQMTQQQRMYYDQSYQAGRELREEQYQEIDRRDNQEEQHIVRRRR